ncbi:MAG: hypothetical protein IPG96_06590 [Proteobacteria bacterium]|nr:hypothetical protein [Pseudomonadota bacterium]
MGLLCDVRGDGGGRGDGVGLDAAGAEGLGEGLGVEALGGWDLGQSLVAGDDHLIGAGEGLGGAVDALALGQGSLGH